MRDILRLLGEILYEILNGTDFSIVEPSLNLNLRWALFKWKAVRDTEIPDRKATLLGLSRAVPLFASHLMKIWFGGRQRPFGGGPRRQAR